MLMDAGADPRARNAAGRCAADLASQPELARLLAREEAWLAAVGAPRSCHVLLAGARPSRASPGASCPGRGCHVHVFPLCVSTVPLGHAGRFCLTALHWAHG